MLTAEQRAERREAAAKKRAANKEAWERHPANANAAWLQRQLELKEAAEIPVALPSVAETGSLAALRAIMADQAAPLHRRLDAAEVVLAYELAPAALANAPNDQVAAVSFMFLRAVADCVETPDALRFRALKHIAAIENARAAKHDPDQAASEREALIASANSVRRHELRRAGCWPVPEGVRWWLDRADIVDAPPEPHGDRDLESMLALPAAELQWLFEARQTALLAITATNRDDVTWRALIGLESPRPDA
jgi:hypothetical protein